MTRLEAPLCLCGKKQGEHLLEFPSLRYGAAEGCQGYSPQATARRAESKHAGHRRSRLSDLFILCEECALARVDSMTKAEDGHVRRSVAQVICKRQIPGYEVFLRDMGFECPPAGPLRVGER